VTIHTSVLPELTATTNEINYLLLEGKVFSIHNVTPLNAGYSLDREIQTPTTGTRYTHFYYDIETSGDTEIFLYESPTLTRSTEITNYNSNRNLSTISTTKFYDVTAVSVVGTRIYWSRTGMGGASVKQGSTGIVSKIILKQNTNYLFRFTSYNNGNIISSAIYWYEYDENNPP